MADKVKFNIHNVHYAVAKDGGGWDAPVAIPGAVSFSLEPQGDVSPFYADGMVYYNAVANNGYSGDLEMAMFPKDFLTAVFGMSEGTTSKVLTENSKTEPKSFALLFEEDGDTTGTKYVLYNCTATRPTRDFKTNEDSNEPSTSKISVTAAPLSDGRVLAMTQYDTPTETVNKWYTKVFEETA